MESQRERLILHIDAGAEADKEEQARFARRLREDLGQLNVDAVEQVASGPALPGAKGDPVTLTTLAVTLAPLVVSELMKTLRAWLSRHQHAKVTVESGGEKIVITGSPSKEEQQVMEAFINRHGH